MRQVWILRPGISSAPVIGAGSWPLISLDSCSDIGNGCAHSLRFHHDDWGSPLIRLPLFLRKLVFEITRQLAHVSRRTE